MWPVATLLGRTYIEHFHHYRNFSTTKIKSTTHGGGQLKKVLFDYDDQRNVCQFVVSSIYSNTWNKRKHLSSHYNQSECGSNPAVIFAISFISRLDLDALPWKGCILLFLFSLMCSLFSAEQSLNEDSLP